MNRKAVIFRNMLLILMFLLLIVVVRLSTRIVCLEWTDGKLTIHINPRFRVYAKISPIRSSGEYMLCKLELLNLSSEKILIPRFNKDLPCLWIWQSHEDKSTWLTEASRFIGCEYETISFGAKTERLFYLPYKDSKYDIFVWGTTDDPQVFVLMQISNFNLQTKSNRSFSKIKSVKWRYESNEYEEHIF